MDAFDAVVVGAGHNGLAAAIHLLNRGWSVAVIEQAGEPGGAVKTREVTLPGFRHDLCAMNLSLFAGSPFFAAHKDELTAQGLAFAPAADCFASVFRDHTYLGVSKDLEKTATAIAALSAKDAAAWRAMLARFGEEAPHIFGLLGSPMPSFATARTVMVRMARQRHAIASRSRPPPACEPTRFPGRAFRIAEGQGDDGRLGHAPRFSARGRGRRAFSLSRVDGEPGLRHGHRRRRRGCHHSRDDRPHQGEGRRDQARIRRSRGSRATQAARPA